MTSAGTFSKAKTHLSGLLERVAKGSGFSSPIGAIPWRCWSRPRPSRSGKWLSYLSPMPVVLDSQTEARAWSDTISLDRPLGLTSCGALYLELA